MDEIFIKILVIIIILGLTISMLSLIWIIVADIFNMPLPKLFNKKKK